ncbi:MAG TPA: Flp family type IVb pilin [Planctomycetota bacterium]|nr:Flp family type IVb pilin [Planctomycetota bacterium]
MKTLRKLFKKDDGQSLVEYALIISLVAIALVAGLGVLQGGISDTFDMIVTSL